MLVKTDLKLEIRNKYSYLKQRISFKKFNFKKYDFLPFIIQKIKDQHLAGKKEVERTDACYM